MLHEYEQEMAAYGTDLCGGMLADHSQVVGHAEFVIELFGGSGWQYTPAAFHEVFSVFCGLH